LAIAALDDSGAELFRRRSDAPNGAYPDALRTLADAVGWPAELEVGKPASVGSERRRPFWRKPGSSRTPTRAC